MGNLWHVKNWFRTGHNISWALNFHTLFGFLQLSAPNKFFYSQSQKKHKFILNYIKTELPDVIEKYRHVNENPDAGISHRIWILWWQGEDSAPPLVKACIDSTRKNAGSAEVTVITKDNYKEYIDIPSYILDKQKKGWISFAQLSDIIRYMLLSKHGGLWLDATVYTAQPIPSACFDYYFFSQHTKPEKNSAWVQNNAYHGFIVGSRKNAKLACFMRDMFLSYWQTHDTLVDYLMVDYLIMTACIEFPDIRQEINSLPYSSERLYDLVHLLDRPFNEAEFDKLRSECIFSKLDWHKKYIETAEKQKTYYYMLTRQTKT